MSTIFIEDVWTVETPGENYTTGATMTKTRRGEILAVFSGGRRHHVCPFGQVHLIASRDEGKTWTYSRVIMDSALDDRDTGILQTSKGTLLVTWFNSNAWELVMDKGPSVWHGGKAIALDEVEDAEWRRRRERLTGEVRSQLGCWLIRSTDGGASWSAPIPTRVNSPHGPCELSDGRLLYVGKKEAENTEEIKEAENLDFGSMGGPFCTQIGVSVSSDDGESWHLIGNIEPMVGHNVREYHEPHAVEASDGTIIVHIRNQNDLHLNETLQTESKDGGRTWSTPHSIGIWGFPAFLMRTQDGRIVSCYSHRREPFGHRVIISDDSGRTWSSPLILNDDSCKDFGYPSTVELSGGRFISMWYDMSESRDGAFLRLARWHLT